MKNTYADCDADVQERWRRSEAVANWSKRDFEMQILPFYLEGQNRCFIFVNTTVLFNLISLVFSLSAV